jgi:hypothetical protein
MKGIDQREMYKVISYSFFLFSKAEYNSLDASCPAILDSYKGPSELHHGYKRISHI